MSERPEATPTHARRASLDVELDTAAKVFFRNGSNWSEFYDATVPRRPDRPDIGRLPDHHDGQHPDMEREVTVIQGRRFPTCRHCKGISFELVYAAKHVGEIDHLHEAEQGAVAAG